MTKRLQGKIAFITGASQGIGRATALRFAQEGATLVICARRENLIREVADDIEKAGGKVQPLVLDVGDLAAYERAIKDAAARYGRLDVLINNAMDAAMSPLTEQSLEGWQRAFRINAEAPFVSTREAMKIMKAQGGGSIINVISIAGLRGVYGAAAYGASKAALQQFSVVAALEGAPFNVRVNTISPGVLETQGLWDNVHGDKNVAAAIAKSIPMQRLGRPEDGANAALFLASDESAYVTGICLPVDGGKNAALDPSTSALN